jgi:hypothetical protein
LIDMGDANAAMSGFEVEIPRRRLRLGLDDGDVGLCKVSLTGSLGPDNALTRDALALQ